MYVGFVCEAGCTCGYRVRMGDDLLGALALAWAHRASVEVDVAFAGTNWYDTPGHEQWYARLGILPNGRLEEVECGGPSRIPTPTQRGSRTLAAFGVGLGPSHRRDEE